MQSKREKSDRHAKYDDYENESRREPRSRNRNSESKNRDKDENRIDYRAVKLTGFRHYYMRTQILQALELVNGVEVDDLWMPEDDSIAKFMIALVRKSRMATKLLGRNRVDIGENHYRKNELLF